MSFASFSAFAAGRLVKTPSEKTWTEAFAVLADEELDFYWGARIENFFRQDHDSPRSCYTLVEHLLRVHQYSSAS